MLKPLAVMTLILASITPQTGGMDPTERPSFGSFLERAIERGVPLFNQGQPAACAAVYATALEAVAAAGWSLSEQQRDHLAYALDMAATIEDPIDQAWAYRALIDTLLAGESLPPPATAESRVLFDFEDSSDVDRWAVVLDGVMGGLSTGRIEEREAGMAFTGETSLRNNGGFSSIRARVPPGSLAGYDALRLQLKGDGRTWIVGASRGSGARGDSYWARFETRNGEWQTITVPIASMERQYFGRPIGGRIQPSAVGGLELYIYDKKAGDFALEIDTIEAVRIR